MIEDVWLDPSLSEPNAGPRELRKDARLRSVTIEYQSG